MSLAGVLLLPASASAADDVGPELFGIPWVFFLFGLTLLGVALFHHHTLRVAVIGLGVITAYRLAFTTFDGTPGLAGLLAHLGHEWVVLANLFGLLVGFGLLARHFEESRLPELLPALLPDDWTGGVALLGMVFVLSSFLDNIAAAIIGATMASSVYRHRVHIGFLAAVVAASNAGGSGSVVGDTTTTMMWIEGVPPAEVFHAYVAAVAAFIVFSIPIALVQQQFAPITKDVAPGLQLDHTRVAIVGFILAAAVAANVVANTRFPASADSFPWIGAAVCLAVLVTAPLRQPDWRIVPGTVAGSVFLLSLVTAASMMPVDRLPDASWPTALGLGFVSAVFDNIPLTKLALEQNGYDWGMLAYAVGFGGSMIWFGSSAGVAVTTRFPGARSVGAWLRHGWPIAVGYVVGFFVLLWLVGWQPHVLGSDLP